MTGNEFQRLAMRTNNKLEFTKQLTHAAMGVAGEAGEIIDTVKKFSIYGHQLNVPNLREEAGDVMWFVALLCDTIGADMEDVMAECIEKLKKRYPEQYTSELAAARLDKA